MTKKLEEKRGRGSFCAVNSYNSRRPMVEQDAWSVSSEMQAVSEDNNDCSHPISGSDKFLSSQLPYLV